MNETVVARPPVAKPLMVTRSLRSSLQLLGAATMALTLMGEPAAAQTPNPGSRNPVCMRLEAQLVAIDRGNADPARAGEIRRLEDMAGRQQADLDRVTAQARRLGCEGRGFFSLFGGQPQQCGPINSQMQQMRANLDRILGELQRLQGNTADREGQRRGVLVALGQSDCGPQYRSYANRGGFFENLFGPGPGAVFGSPGAGAGDTYRTLCVRACDGYYFPISYSTQSGKFAEDEKTCQAMCPAAEVSLYTHRNPGEDVSQAVSTSGRSYSELPNAFAYRKAFNPSCSCKAVGQTWADALKHLDDQTVERGDIVVNEERARVLSQPQVDAQGRPIRPAPKSSSAKGKTAPAAAAAPAPIEAAPAETATPASDAQKRQVRTVGPTFLPGR